MVLIYLLLFKTDGKLLLSVFLKNMNIEYIVALVLIYIAGMFISVAMLEKEIKEVDRESKSLVGIVALGSWISVLIISLVRKF